MNIVTNTVTRRAHGTKPGDEHIHFIGEPVELALKPLPAEVWSSPARLHIPRIQPQPAWPSWPLWVALCAALAFVIVAGVQ